MRLEIKKLGINGEGIAYLQDNTNKVCFVEGALPGEVIDATILKDKKTYSIASLNEILTKSKDRVCPPCRYYSVCGGCDIQHMSKVLQLSMKADNIRDTIRKISGIDIEVNKPIRINDWAYRNKMVFPYVQKDNISVLGMFAKNSHNIVDIDKCLLASENLNKFLLVTKEYLSRSNYQGYNFRDKTGDIKYVVAREQDKNILVTIVALKKLNLEEYYNCLKTHFNSVGLSLVVSDSDEEIMSGKYYHLYGEEYLRLEEFGIKYKIDNRGFLQVNNDIKHYLYEYILEKIDNNISVIDAYSGAGLLSAIISKKCKNVIGIEINKSASNSASNLAIENNLNNIKFINGDVKDNITKAIESVENCAVILDPPRAGCDESILRLLVDINSDKSTKLSEKSNVCKVSKIIYISCNVATLARDLKVLKEGYRIESVTPMEMFPQTKHIETIVVMERKEKVNGFF